MATAQASTARSGKSAPFALMVLLFYGWFAFRGLALPGLEAYETRLDAKEMDDWSEKLELRKDAEESRSSKQKKRSKEVRASSAPKKPGASAPSDATPMASRSTSRNSSESVPATRSQSR